MENIIGKNRQSPANEALYISAYKDINKSARKLNDGYDVAAVTAKNGIKGYGLMSAETNRSHDKDWHRVKDFVPTSEVKKRI